MPEKIGKYHIVERLGSGGMGTIFKAHDPVLDRLVALKVISTDVEITDELRARFFREAQACARLSHPNIVTVYTMGDEEGQLFIVMELLEGEELKHLIAQRSALALEDKLSIMVQVCHGLHYAHQNGIVHRDIKPGNIFLQRSGQVKILDFGIAQMANAEGGLTRAGLIMGSLRYISPEQVRGRVDHRSDIFSLGAVLYEFLSMRPPFTGEDPLSLLEQLRTEEPPALDQLDPTIPSELTAVVARAMRKDPAERFTDLDQMRSQLEEVQRGLTEESRRCSARVRDQRGQLLQLRAALVERVGPSGTDEPVPTLDERARLTTIRALERDFSARIEALQAEITRADSRAPALRRATELLRDGLLSEAVGEFEAILAEMPEHARARDGLEQARAQVEVLRRRQLAAQLAQEARAALDEGSLTLTLEILERAGQIPPPAEAVGDIAGLRATVDAAVAARDAARRARQEAEGARGHMEGARRAAQSQGGPQYASALWDEAEVKSTEAATALAREAYGEARQGFEAAITVYDRVEAAAREAQRREHETAEHARSQAAHNRQRAHAEGAPQYAREQWDAAEVKSAQAQMTYAQKRFGRADEIFKEAVDLYGLAEATAREARLREVRCAEEARRQMARSRDRAQTAGGSHYTREQWDAAEARSTEAEAAFGQHAYAQAGLAFDGAAAMYRTLEEVAREARRHDRAAAEQMRQLMVQARRAAELQGAPRYAPGLWDEAEAKSPAAEAALGREAYTEASEAFEAAASAYHRIEEVAGEARRQEREGVEQAREQMAQARRAAEAQAAPQCARGLWDEAEAKSAEAAAALTRGAYGEAREAFATVAGAYRRVEEVARRAQERQAAERARAQTAQVRERAQTAGAPRYTRELWAAAQAEFAEAQGAFSQERYATAADAFDRVLARYQEAEKQTGEARVRQREDAERTRQAMAERRNSAVAADAATHAPSEWQEAEASAAAGEAAFAREAYAEASGAFQQSAGLYHRTEERAREVVLSLATARVHAETMREALDLARHAAQDAQALKYASEQWRAGENTEAQAADALRLEVEQKEREVSTTQDVTTDGRWSDDSLEQTVLQSRGAPGVAVAEVLTSRPGSTSSLRRLTMSAAAVLAVIGLGTLLWLPRGPSTAPPSKALRVETEELPRAPSLPQPERPADPSPPRSMGGPLTPRQALDEVFEGRNQAHTVTATVPKGVVRIGRDNLGFSIASSRPGYAYVMIVRSNGADIELLLPNAADRNNYIEPGHPLKLPGQKWPLKAQGPPGTSEFFAIVSDAPRDFSALGPTAQGVFQRFRLGNRPLDRGPSGSSPLLAGAVACVSATRCSESYGAVVFSIDTVGREPEVRSVARRPPSVPAPLPRPEDEGSAPPPRHQVSPRCSNILERASLGEPLTDEERTMLTRNCR